MKKKIKIKKRKRNKKIASTRKRLYSFNDKYANYMGSDCKLCKPLLNKDQISLMLFNTQNLLEKMKIEIKKTKAITFDLDQLMTLDYRSLPKVTTEQKIAIEEIFNSSPTSPEELIFQTLRTFLFTSFPLPESEDELVNMAFHRDIENYVALKMAYALSEEFAEPMSLQPYWPRLSQLRIMMHIPEEVIKKTKLDNIIFYPVKKKGMNASSLVYDNFRFITVNYALEPILDDFNTILIHFHSTEEMAGVKRYDRALSYLLPRSLYFSTEISPLKFPANPICFENNAQNIHNITAEQIDFIMMHELSHHLYHHPQRKKDVLKKDDASSILRSFEIEADALAAKMIAIKFQDGVNRSLKRKERKIPYEVEYSLSLSLTSTLILFEHMYFVEESLKIMSTKLIDLLPIKTISGTHPPAKERKERFLEAMGDRLRGSSPISRYSSVFYNKALTKLESLTADEIMEILKPCLYE
ncbi:hypothetical protein HV169_11575 [Citrobacter freundii]|uniref:hypothetical protein n=1 Tax=Citrobacter freundii TaxID=546 RepID=UPI0015F5C59D|nr:hypothetical protein [Citrobacter freundii]